MTINEIFKTMLKYFAYIDPVLGEMDGGRDETMLSFLKEKMDGYIEQDKEAGIAIYDQYLIK